MIADPVFYLLAIPAVILMGLSKGGFAGVGALSLPLLVFATDAVRAAAILLPLLIVQDVVSVWAFRRSVDRFVLGWMLPGAAVGVALGYLFAAAMSPRAVMAAVGGISALFGLYRLWVERRAAQGEPGVPRFRHLGAGWVGTLFGVVSGATSQVAHAGGPPFQLWVVPRRLPPAMLAGTTAVFFAVTNWLKVPAYWALGQFTAANLLTSAALVPVAIISTFAGVWLLRRIDATRFYTLIYALMIATGVKLVWDGVA